MTPDEQNNEATEDFVIQFPDYSQTDFEFLSDNQLLNLNRYLALRQDSDVDTRLLMELANRFERKSTIDSP